MSTVREKSFERSITALDAVFGFIDDYVAEFTIVPAVAYTLQFAVEEVFTNLVKYDPQADPAIRIRISRDDTRIVAIVMNAGGRNFDMTSIRGADNYSDLSESGGLGIYLVKRMVHEFRYEYKDGTGIITISASLEG